MTRNNILYEGSWDKHIQRLKKYWYKFDACETCGVAAGEACLAVNSLPRYKSANRFAHKGRVNHVKVEKQRKKEARKTPEKDLWIQEQLDWFAKSN